MPEVRAPLANPRPGCSPCAKHKGLRSVLSVSATSRGPARPEIALDAAMALVEQGFEE